MLEWTWILNFANETKQQMKCIYLRCCLFMFWSDSIYSIYVCKCARYQQTNIVWKNDNAYW